MNILNFDKGISLYEINNTFYFDLEDLAGKIGYSKPKDAVRDFVRRNADFRFRTARCGDGRKLYDEPSLYYFLMRSEAPRAKEWQYYICTEVLPLVRSVGIKAIKETKAHQILTQSRHNIDLLPSVQELLGDDTEQFLLDNHSYRVLGYLPPSEVSPVSLPTFWRTIEKVGIENFDAVYCPKFHNSYTQDGKWYAFKPDQFDTIEWDISEPEHQWPSSAGELT